MIQPGGYTYEYTLSCMNTTPQHTMEQKHTNRMLYTASEITNKKRYTSSAKKKRTCLSRSTNTLANSRQRNHEERTQKRFFLFFFTSFCRKCTTTRKARKHKSLYFFPNTQFFRIFLSWNVIEHHAPSAKREKKKPGG